MEDNEIKVVKPKDYIEPENIQRNFDQVIVVFDEEELDIVHMLLNEKPFARIYATRDRDASKRKFCIVDTDDNGNETEGELYSPDQIPDEGEMRVFYKFMSQILEEEYIEKDKPPLE